MTTEIYTPNPPHPIAGPGPYAVTLRIDAASELYVYVENAVQAVILTPDDFTATLNPDQATSPGGALTLTAEAATLHDGATLQIGRRIDVEQGWAGINGGREAALEAQLDRMVQSQQDQARALQGALRLVDPINPIPAPALNRALVGDGTGGVKVGPDLTSLDAISGEIAAAVLATDADAAAAALDAARAEVAANFSESLLISFNDRWLGVKSSPPTTDNDGDPLQISALYSDNVLNGTFFWNGTDWIAFNAGVQTLADLGITATVEEVNKLNGVVGDIVGTETEQNLLNKTLTTPLVNVGSDAPGDLYQRNAAGTGFERIAVGASGTALVSDGTKWASGVSITTTDFIAQDRRASGVDGNTPTSNSWNKRVINSIVKTNAAISIAANNVTVAEGRWSVEVLAGGYRISRNQLRIVQRVPPAAFDPATGSTYGISSNLSDGNFVGGISQVQGEIDATGGPVEFYIDHWTQNSAAGGLGVFSNSMGGVEVHLNLHMKRTG